MSISEKYRYCLHFSEKAIQLKVFPKDSLWDEARKQFQIPQKQEIQFQIEDQTEAGENKRYSRGEADSLPDGPLDLRIILDSYKSQMSRETSIPASPTPKSVDVTYDPLVILI